MQIQELKKGDTLYIALPERKEIIRVTIGSVKIVGQVVITTVADKNWSDYLYIKWLCGFKYTTEMCSLYQERAFTSARNAQDYINAYIRKHKAEDLAYFLRSAEGNGMDPTFRISDFTKFLHPKYINKKLY